MTSKTPSAELDAILDGEIPPTFTEAKKPEKWKSGVAGIFQGGKFETIPVEGKKGSFTHQHTQPYPGEERFEMPFGYIYLKREKTLFAAEESTPYKRNPKAMFFVWSLPGGGYGWTDDDTNMPKGFKLCSTWKAGRWNRKRGVPNDGGRK